MKVSSITIDENNRLRCNWMRSKTGEYGRYIVPVNLDKWWLCFGYALATQIILSRSIDDQLFCNISQSSFNGCFKALYSHWLKSADSAKPYNYTNNMTVHSLSQSSWDSSLEEKKDTRAFKLCTRWLV